MGHVQNRKIHRVREWVPGCQGLGRGVIAKGGRNIFGVMEMFQNMAVVTAAQLSELSPRAPVQPVRVSLSG